MRKHNIANLQLQASLPKPDYKTDYPAYMRWRRARIFFNLPTHNKMTPEQAIERRRQYMRDYCKARREKLKHIAGGY